MGVSKCDGGKSERSKTRTPARGPNEKKGAMRQDEEDAAPTRTHLGGIEGFRHSACPSSLRLLLRSTVER